LAQSIASSTDAHFHNQKPATNFSVSAIGLSRSWTECVTALGSVVISVTVPTPQ
jgi:hypothetical protein